MIGFIYSHKKKLIVLSAIIMLSSLAYFVPFVKSNGGSFYSGDAVSYRGKAIIGTVNRDSLEIFEIINGKIQKVSAVQNKEKIGKFYDLALVENNQRLYAYLVDGRYFYKYDISDRNNPILINKIKDNSWDWFTGVQIAGDRIVTIGTNNIKIWNHDMQVVDSFKGVKNENSYNISFSPRGDYIFNILEDSIQIYDAYSRSDYDNFSPYFIQSHYRKMYYDPNYEDLFVVDDKNISRYYLDKNKKKAVKLLSSKHSSEHGYDVAALAGSKYIYFSDGIGIVKAEKETLKMVDWVWSNLIGTKFNWAQGLNVIRLAGREIIIGFNINGIVALNDEMGVIDYYEISNKNSDEKKVFLREDLFLRLDKPLVFAGGNILLSGGGFASNEELEIKYLNLKKIVKSDNNGRFSTNLNIPQIDPIYTSIDVLGKISKSNYSISLDIK